jgi:hypothetical protein
MDNECFCTVRLRGLTGLPVSLEGSHVMTRESKFSDWRKARLSDATGNCVEIASAADGTVGVRDSKDQGDGPVLEFTRAEWNAFLDGVKNGQFDAQ